jgi:aerobic carbon-monoxide dehydrogenase large subunit
MNKNTVENGIGASVLRKEDQRLIRGQGCFSDDISLKGQKYINFLRSPHAHARIISIDCQQARAHTGVVAVYTGADLVKGGIKPLPHHVWALHPADIAMNSYDGSETFTAPHYPMAHDKVRHVGEIVAMIIADSVNEAKDAAELIRVNYDILPCNTDTLSSVDPSTPLVWDEAKSNVCADVIVGDHDATEAAFARAKHIAKIDTWVQRVAGVPLEPRAAVCSFDDATQRLTIYAGSGGAVRLKHDLAHVLNLSSDDVHVIMRDVGGNFGTRGMIYPEFCLVGWAARDLRQPLKWTCERSEAFLSDYQGRDLHVHAELALDEHGRFLAMRGSNIGNAGAHTSNFSPLQKGVEIMTSIYDIPHACFRARPVVTNTLPTRPYRSAGRPEVMFVMERLIDIAAQQCHFDRVELRRLNLIKSEQLPYLNPFGMKYESGNYTDIMNTVLTLGDWAGFAERKQQSAAQGKLRGIGVANYVDTATGVPRERAEMTVHADGRVDVIIGTISNGQGHDTSFAQVVTHLLGVPFEHVHIITGDTDVVKIGGGTHSGRGMRLAGFVLHDASQMIIHKAKKIFALHHNTDIDSISFNDGYLHSRDYNLSLSDIARIAIERNDLPDDLHGPLTAVSDMTINEASFPYGAHVCEVEIDPELCTVAIANYCTVDDVGCAVNPMIIHGQTHGGIAQGVGQALMEHCVYDEHSGQLLSASFLDYAMPRADHFPQFTTHSLQIPDPAHPLGIRPAGEGGTTPALAVVINAIVDALSSYGVEHIDMPATPQKIWRAIYGQS